MKINNVKQIQWSLGKIVAKKGTFDLSNPWFMSLYHKDGFFSITFVFSVADLVIWLWIIPNIFSIFSPEEDVRRSQKANDIHEKRSPRSAGNCQILAQLWNFSEKFSGDYQVSYLQFAYLTFNDNTRIRYRSCAYI